MTDIIISGANGHMGHMIYECIKDRSDCQVVAGIDINTEKYADFPIFATPSELNVKGDVIIDFSHPALLDALLEYSSKTGTPVVYATTGYTDEQIDKIKEAAETSPVFFSWNMSMGINLLVELSKKAAAFLCDQFDIEILEKHHNRKLDAPSGTALMLANGINEVFDGEKEYV
ncbi:MAG: 4-hydroxy-tetrahydrodipicolinate reductase, partial [Oscillospiraceae bacterium]|nr:4-hydroxy-tetrahydrodipicolinate reductase [Oscillospiraceae bacterium]